MMRARSKAALFQNAERNLRLFMMMDSLRTGGSERQFALLAGAFRRRGHTDKEQQVALARPWNESRTAQSDRFGATGRERMTKDHVWNRWSR